MKTEILNLWIALNALLASLMFIFEQYQKNESTRIRSYINLSWEKFKVSSFFEVPNRALRGFSSIRNLPTFLLLKIFNNSIATLTVYVTIGFSLLSLYVLEIIEYGESWLGEISAVSLIYIGGTIEVLGKTAKYTGRRFAEFKESFVKEVAFFSFLLIVINFIHIYFFELNYFLEKLSFNPKFLSYIIQILFLIMYTFFCTINIFVLFSFVGLSIQLPKNEKEWKTAEAVLMYFYLFTAISIFLSSFSLLLAFNFDKNSTFVAPLGLVFSNIIFDIITIATSYIIIKRVINMTLVINKILFIFVDIIASSIYAILALKIGLKLSGRNINYTECLNLLLFKNLEQGDNISLSFMMHTTFFPTVTYLGFILILILIKAVLQLMKYFTIPAKLDRPYNLFRSIFLFLASLGGLLLYLLKY